MKLVSVLVVSILLFEFSRAYLMSSFNIQVFGDKKMSKKHIPPILAKILSRYDLTCIQEIRDSDGDSLGKLVNLINSGRNNQEGYVGLAGERLGRTSSKEQYGVIYLPKKFTLSNLRTYPNHRSEFERPPMQVHVKPKAPGIPNFELLIVHLDPQKVFEEMEALYEVAQEVVTKINDNLLILGDMNAGCSYLSKSKKKTLKFTQDTSYTWLVNDNLDTTVGKTDCAYDRLIVHGEKLRKTLVRNSVKAYRYPEAMHLDQKTALEVSDHYPVEIEMKSSSGNQPRLGNSNVKGTEEPGNNCEPVGKPQTASSLPR
ncbi:putative deoxyribonuclease I (DNase I) [Fasciola gigantica]|uniref:Deoxyribonuclease n=1 Tax=Fasciola gigantica TaxID=46835 RepID=A0A504YD90_FASGI|nr:putative deoxyribonuclease I (DNase I) [Fasciola gigantica]